MLVFILTVVEIKPIIFCSTNSLLQQQQCHWPHKGHNVPWDLHIGHCRRYWGPKVTMLTWREIRVGPESVRRLPSRLKFKWSLLTMTKTEGSIKCKHLVGLEHFIFHLISLSSTELFVLFTGGPHPKVNPAKGGKNRQPRKSKGSCL